MLYMGYLGQIYIIHNAHNIVDRKTHITNSKRYCILFSSPATIALAPLPGFEYAGNEAHQNVLSEQTYLHVDS